MLLRGADLSVGRGVTERTPVVATLPEAAYFTENGLNGRMSPACELLEEGCWFFLSFFLAFSSAPLVSEASPFVFLMNV